MSKLETLCLHAGYTPEPTTKSEAVPLYRTAAYRFDSTEHAANLFALKEPGNIYTRLMNPTTAVLEERVAALEGGAAGLALASGTSAVFYSIINLAKAGDEIVAANNLYGGTYTQFNDILPSLGIKVHLVDPSDPQNFASAINDKTKALYCESIGNPALELVDIQAIADVAHANGLPLIVDSTFTSPSIGGIVVDSGKFDWTTGKHPLLSEPDPSYHDIRYASDLGDLNPLAYILRMRLVPLRNLGATIAPDNAWNILQGIETLALRMERHSENGLSVAKHLQQSDKVEWVKYAGFDPKAETYLPNGAGGMVVFEIKGGEEAGRKFIEALNLFSHLANVGDAKSLAIHPASTTHSQLTPEQQAAGGISPGLIRLSVGLEHIDDILSDIDQALSNV